LLKAVELQGFRSYKIDYSAHPDDRLNFASCSLWNAFRVSLPGQPPGVAPCVLATARKVTSANIRNL